MEGSGDGCGSWDGCGSGTAWLQRPGATLLYGHTSSRLVDSYVRMGSWNVLLPSNGVRMCLSSAACHGNKVGMRLRGGSIRGGTGTAAPGGRNDNERGLGPSLSRRQLATVTHGFAVA